MKTVKPTVRRPFIFGRDRDALDRWLREVCRDRPEYYQYSPARYH